MNVGELRAELAGLPDDLEIEVADKSDLPAGEILTAQVATYTTFVPGRDPETEQAFRIQFSEYVELY